MILPLYNKQSKRNTKPRRSLLNQLKFNPKKNFNISPLKNQPSFSFKANSLSTRSNSQLTSTSLTSIDNNQKESVLLSKLKTQKKKAETKTRKTKKISFFKYKTNMCKNFMLGKSCKWGSECFFAHGKE